VSSLTAAGELAASSRLPPPKSDVHVSLFSLSTAAGIRSVGSHASASDVLLHTPTPHHDTSRPAGTLLHSQPRRVRAKSRHRQESELASSASWAAKLTCTTLLLFFLHILPAARRTSTAGEFNGRREIGLQPPRSEFEGSRQVYRRTGASAVQAGLTCPSMQRPTESNGSNQSKNIHTGSTQTRFSGPVFCTDECPRLSICGRNIDIV
jgi:hypothetical protein